MSSYRRKMMMYAAINRSIPGFVGGWKAYGRSNNEDASTRNIIPDYSGNGRDIKLHNFNFTEESGYYNHYITNFLDWDNGNNYTSVLKSNYFIVTKPYNNEAIIFTNGYSGSKIPIKVTGITGTNLRLEFGSGTINPSESSIYEDGIYTVQSNAGTKGFKLYGENKVVNIKVELVPEYTAGLISDGIDDFGQCITDFSLPDDFTIVTIRKHLGSQIHQENCFLGKSKGAGNGAFIFELRNETNKMHKAFSYYGTCYINNYIPDLFSYMTKTSYNGLKVNYGNATDTNEDKLILFGLRPNDYRCCKAILYDLRIYDHSLTDSELQMVKAEMISDYEAATGNTFTE